MADEMTVTGLAWWRRGRIWGVVLVICLAAVAAGAVATVGFGQDVRAAVNYGDLVEVMLRWHGRLVFWSRVAWAAVAIAVLLVGVGGVVRWRQGLSYFPRGLAIVLVLLLVAWMVDTGLVWHFRIEQGRSEGELFMVPAATQIGDQAREATFATSPLFPAYGWFGSVVVVLVGTVTVLGVLSGHRDRDS